ncbi:unnamed protein product [Ranitomeya imitator]|uniref:Helix-turn-helix domain-containing protein n=1 Tax=Ranitomeya imitator TaxID=111125 RepID=A0ABN9L5W1_9NEOB|nr:unnamed protein product [Ranitomeya imitator]
MAFFEEHFVYSNTDFQDYTTIWRRYIDYIFCIWRGPLDSLLSFHKIIKHSDGTLEIDLHVKETDRNSLLLFSSCHPRATREFLPLSQFNRISRIVSNPVMREIRLDETQKKFSERGYPNRLLNKMLIPREQISTTSSVGTRLPFIHSFHPFMYRLHKNIRKHWSILRTSYPKIKEFQVPFMPCFRRPTNLRDRLVRADVGSTKRLPLQTFLDTPKIGTFPCLHCSQCGNVQRGEKFFHPHTGEGIQIRGFYTCESSFVVYAVKCPCGLV